MSANGELAMTTGLDWTGDGCIGLRMLRGAGVEPLLLTGGLLWGGLLLRI